MEKEFILTTVQGTVQHDGKLRWQEHEVAGHMTQAGNRELSSLSPLAWFSTPCGETNPTYNQDGFSHISSSNQDYFSQA